MRCRVVVGINANRLGGWGRGAVCRGRGREAWGRDWLGGCGGRGLARQAWAWEKCARMAPSRVEGMGVAKCGGKSRGKGCRTLLAMGVDGVGGGLAIFRCARSPVDDGTLRLTLDLDLAGEVKTTRQDWSGMVGAVLQKAARP